MKLKTKGLQVAILAVLVMFVMSVFTLTTPVARAEETAAPTTVATVNGTGYATLQEAVTAAETYNYEKIVMTADATVAETILVGKKLVIDLHGKKITAASGEAWGEGDSLFTVKRGGKLVVMDDSEGAKGIIDASSLLVAIKLTAPGETGTAEAGVEVHGGTVIGGTYGISGNGLRNGTSVVVDGGAVTGIEGAGIFNPQTGTVTISGNPTITGKTAAIEMRAGTLNISGGIFRATATEFKAEQTGNGTAITGAAIAIAQHQTSQPISATISGGKFYGEYAFYEDDFKDGTNASVTLAIHGGLFEGNVHSTSVNGYILGGQFTSILENADVINQNNISIVSFKNANADVYYVTLQEAINAAAEGEEIVVLQKVYTVTEEINIFGKVTINLNGKTLKTTSTSTGWRMFSVNPGADVTFKNGTIDAYVVAISIVAYSGADATKAIAHLAEDLIVKAETDNAVYVQGQAVLNTSATISSNSTGYAAISGNGNEESWNTTINVNGGSITSNNEVAIYHPQVGNLNIYAGTITGATGIVMRNGNLTINPNQGKEVKVIATGENFVEETGTSGTSIEGAAIAISDYTSTEGAPKADIRGGIFEGVVSFYETVEIDGVANKDTTISGGAFYGDVKAENITKFISGTAQFDTQIDRMLPIEGFAIADKADTTNGLYNIVAAEADYNNAGYETFEGALAAAKAGTGAAADNVIQLFVDLAPTEVISINFNVTIDLGGKTINSTANRVFYVGPTTAGQAVEFVIDNGTIVAADKAFSLDAVDRGVGTLTATFGSKLTVTAANEVAVIVGNTTFNTEATLTSNSTAKMAVVGNGGAAYGGTIINIKGGSITSTNTPAVYHPQVGFLNVTGGTITGTSGIVMRNGELNITGEGVVVNASATTFVPETANNGDGTDVAGAAIAISDGTTDGAPTANITAGTFNGPVAFYEYNEVETTEVEPTVAISGGKFNGEIKVDKGFVKFISGGKFLKTTAKNEYVVVDYTFDEADAEGYVTVIKAPAKIGDVGYNSLENAIAAAKAGDVIYLNDNAVVDESFNIAVEGAITITNYEGNNYGITFKAGEHTIAKGAELIIKNVPLTMYVEEVATADETVTTLFTVNGAMTLDTVVMTGNKYATYDVLFSVAAEAALTVKATDINLVANGTNNLFVGEGAVTVEGASTIVASKFDTVFNVADLAIADSNVTISEGTVGIMVNADISITGTASVAMSGMTRAAWVLDAVPAVATEPAPVVNVAETATIAAWESVEVIINYAPSAESTQTYQEVLKAAFDTAFVSITDEVVLVNNTFYQNIDVAATAIEKIEEVTVPTQVTLLRDATVEHYIAFVADANFDLNEKVLTANYIAVVVLGGNVTIDNGTIASGVGVDGETFDEEADEELGIPAVDNTATLNLGDKLTINAIEFGVMAYGNVTINTAADIVPANAETAVADTGIFVQNAEDTKATINVIGGTISAEMGIFAIGADVNITAGTITAIDAVVVLGGDLDVTPAEGKEVKIIAVDVAVAIINAREYNVTIAGGVIMAGYNADGTRIEDSEEAGAENPSRVAFALVDMIETDEDGKPLAEQTYPTVAITGGGFYGKIMITENNNLNIEPKFSKNITGFISGTAKFFESNLMMGEYDMYDDDGTYVDIETSLSYVQDGFALKYVPSTDTVAGHIAVCSIEEMREGLIEELNDFIEYVEVEGWWIDDGYEWEYIEKIPQKQIDYLYTLVEEAEAEFAEIENAAVLYRAFLTYLDRDYYNEEYTGKLPDVLNSINKLSDALTDAKILIRQYAGLKHVSMDEEALATAMEELEAIAHIDDINAKVLEIFDIIDELENYVDAGEVTEALDAAKWAAIEELYADANAGEDGVNITSAMIAAIASAPNADFVGMALEAAINELAAIADLKAQIAGIAETATANATALEYIETLIIGLNPAFDTVTSRIEAATEAIEGVQATVDAIQASALTAEQLQAKLDTLQANINAATREAIDSLAEALDAISAKADAAVEAANEAAEEAVKAAAEALAAKNATAETITAANNAIGAAELAKAAADAAKTASEAAKTATEAIQDTVGDANNAAVAARTAAEAAKTASEATQTATNAAKDAADAAKVAADAAKLAADNTGNEAVAITNNQGTLKTLMIIVLVVQAVLAVLVVLAFVFINKKRAN